jgi:hypothetical protein
MPGACADGVSEQEDEAPIVLEGVAERLAENIGTGDALTESGNMDRLRIGDRGVVILTDRAHDDGCWIATDLCRIRKAAVSFFCLLMCAGPA